MSLLVDMFSYKAHFLMKKAAKVKSETRFSREAIKV